MGIGFRVEWEDIFVETLGLSWRDIRDRFQCEAGWMALFADFCRKTCQRYHLFFPNFLAKGSGLDPGHEPFTKRPKTCSYRLEDLPELHGEDAPSMLWEDDTFRFCAVTDCKSLAAVCNGYAQLTTEELRPPFQRITKNIFKLVAMGGRPCTDISDAVIWHKREWNRRADH